MRDTGVEDLKSALRRSAWLIVALVVLGVVAMNAVVQLRGPSYRAEARVLLPTMDIGASVAGIQPVYVEPDRRDSAEENVARSPQLYAFAARRANGAIGRAAEVRSATTVDVKNNVVAFTSVADDGPRAQATVNAVAATYPAWRTEMAGRSIDSALQQLRGQIQRTGRAQELAGELQRLQLLKTLNSEDSLFVEPATAPVQTSPSPARDSMLGAAIGLVVALLVLGIREVLDTTVRSEADVEDALGAPVLASVHSLPRRLRGRVIGGNQPRFADEYDLLAANVAQTFDARAGTVYLAVTSAQPGEGKTTTSANLATALARRGESVVLADFDLRRPSIAVLFAIPRNAAGVKEVLGASTEVPTALWDVPLTGDGTAVIARRRQLVRTGAKGANGGGPEPGAGSLSVLPGTSAGAFYASPERYAQLPDLLPKLDEIAQWVVIDTPPALLVPGMAELGQHVDGVLVVARQGAVHRRRLGALGKSAQAWRARLVGAVLNDVREERGKSYYEGYWNRS